MHEIEQAAQRGDLKGAILAYICLYDHVTFAELTRRLGALGLPVKGDHALTLNRFPTIAMWVNLSGEFSQAITALLSEGAIAATPTALLTYLVDGGVLDLPLAKQARQYKRLHWAPVVLRPVQSARPPRTPVIVASPQALA